MTFEPGWHRTARLLLRRPVETDLTAMHAVHADLETNRFNPAGPTADLATSRMELARWIDHWDRHGFGYWTVCDPGGELTLGFGGLKRTDLDGEPVLNLYYRFGTHAWGRGYAGEMVDAALHLAGQLSAEGPVVALIRDSNTPSRRVAARAGLVPTGRTQHGGVSTLIYRRPDPPGARPASGRTTANDRAVRDGRGPAPEPRGTSARGCAGSGTPTPTVDGMSACQ